MANGMARADALGVPRYRGLKLRIVWRGDLGKAVLGQKWDLVIGDEGHKIKAPGGKASRFCGRLAGNARTRLLLSGTPLPNNPLDMYGQARFLDPGIFGTSFARFRARYAEVATYKGFPEVVGWRNEEEFRRILDLIMFRVDKEVLDLPPLTHSRRYVYLPPKATKVYEKIMSQFVADVEDGVVTAGNALTRLLRLQQITSGFVKDDDGTERELHSEKEEALRELIEGLPQPDEPCRLLQIHT